MYEVAMVRGEDKDITYSDQVFYYEYNVALSPYFML